MNKLFVSYKVAIMLFEKGFNENCLACYMYGEELKFSYLIYHDVKFHDKVVNNRVGYINKENINESFVTAPLYQQVFDWLEENHNIFISFKVNKDKLFNFNFNTEVFNNNRIIYPYSSKYDAYNKAIEEALKLI